MENKSGFHPNGDLVLLQPLPVAETTAGGIALTAKTREAEMRAARVANVVDFGPVASDHPRMQGIERGDTVLIMKYAGDFFQVEGEFYIIMRPDSVFGKITKMLDSQLNAARSSMEVWPSVEAPTNAKDAAPLIVRQ